MNSNVLKIILLLFLFASTDLQSYEKPLKLHHYAKREWSSISGLAHDNVTALYKDANGTIWVGTIEGISRISGASIKTFSTRKTPELLSNRIVDISGSKLGDVTVATEMGVSIIRKSSVKNVFKKKGLVGITQTDSGVIYTATQSELFEIVGGKVNKYSIISGLPKGKILSLTSDGEKVYFANDSGAVHLLNKKTFSDDLCEKNKSAVTAISCSENGMIALGNKQGQIFTIKDGKCGEISIDAAVAVTGSPVLSISAFGDEIKAVTAEYVLSVKGKDVRAFKSSQQLPGSLSEVLYDDDKIMWVAGNRGLKMFYAGAFITLGKDEGLLSEMAYAMVQDRLGKIWVGTRGGGLFYYVDGKFNQVADSSGIPSRFIGGLLVDKAGYIWAGTAKGIVKFKSELPVKIKSVPTVNKNIAPLVSALFQDSKSRIWAGSANGEVYMLLRDGFAFVRSVGDSKNDYVSSIAEDSSGRLWFATSRGLLVLENDSFRKLDSTKGLPGNMILSLYADDSSGNLFAGTMRKGLAVISSDGSRIRNVDTTRGLCSDTIFSISEDDKKNLWFTSTQGIFRLKKADVLKAVNDEKFVLKCNNFDQQDGVRRSENTGGVQPSAMVLDSGRKWFPTVEGIAVKLKGVSGKSTPHILIDDFIINGTKTSVEQGGKIKGEVSLLEIPFVAGRFIHPERLKTRYRLVPFESEWHDVADRYVAIYQKVPSGDYEFKVEVIDEDGKVLKRSVNFSVAGVGFLTVVVLVVAGIFIFFIGFIFFRRKSKTFKSVLAGKTDIRSEKKVKEQNLEDDGPKYEKSRLDDEIAKDYALELEKLMLEEKVYKDTDITMPELAKMLDLSPNVLSQVINGYCGLNFYTYINRFRADEVVEIMKQDIDKRKNVLNIAFDAGFKSKTTFNTFFKKHTGLTPSEFRKQLEKDMKKEK